MSGFASCFWWLGPGFVLGWLAHWLVARGSRRNPSAPPMAVADDGAAREESAAPDDAPVDAVSLSASRAIDVAAARAAGFNLKHDDDLAILEGIGPKLNELLHANGIASFADLARASVPELLEILERGGPHFQLANPGSWARQAALASENRWGELKRLQEELISGRPSSGY